MRIKVQKWDAVKPNPKEKDNIVLILMFIHYN